MTPEEKAATDKHAVQTMRKAHYEIDGKNETLAALQRKAMGTITRKAQKY